MKLECVMRGMGDNHSCPNCGEVFGSERAVGSHRRACGDGPPWQDEELMRELIEEENLTYPEVAERFDCYKDTVAKWARKHGIKRVEKWHRESVLRELYVEEGMTMKEVGNELGCSRETVRYNLMKFGIERTKTGSDKPPMLDFLHGYGRISHKIDGESKYTYTHRLAAVAWFGFDAVEDKEVHHKNRMRADNRESNLEPLTPGDHRREHHLKTNSEIGSGVGLDG